MRHFSALMVLLVVGISSALGQTAGLEARVTYVAGDNVYLAIGRDAGVLPGDSLDVVLPSGDRHWAIVRSAMNDRSVLELSGAATLIKTGESLRFAADHDAPVVIPPDEPAANVILSQLDVSTQSTEVESAPQTSSARGIRRGPRFNGRILGGVGGLRSETTGSAGSGARTTRSFVTPWTMLQFEGQNLPYDLSFRTRVRVDYRYSSGRPTSPQVLFRAYEAFVERSFSRVAVQAGRFSNRYAVTGGYWDGIMLQYGPRNTGIGASVGFLPSRSNGSISSETPKIALFVHNRHRIQDLQQTIFGWYQEIYLPGLQPTRHNFGVSHRARLKRIVSSNRLEVDRDPESGVWTVTRGSAQLSGLVNRWLSVRGRYEISQPYSMYRPFAVISYRRDQITTGATVQLQRTSIGADIVWNYSYRLVEGRQVDGTSIRLYTSTSLSQTIRLNATGSYWTSENGNSSLLNMGASRSFNRLFSRLNYQLNRSTRFGTNVTSHTISAGLSAPLSRRIRSNADVRLQTGSNVTSVGFNLNITLAL